MVTNFQMCEPFTAKYKDCRKQNFIIILWRLQNFSSLVNADLMKCNSLALKQFYQQEFDHFTLSKNVHV